MGGDAGPRTHERTGSPPKKLIKAVVDVVEADGDPPPELSLALMCQKWNTLPDAGGLYEQDARMMKTMSGVLSVYNTVTRWRTLSGKQIHQLTDGERKILRTLKDMGLMLNG